jgi:UDPglucose--hexose-1-phosphate uridylyltransferase
MAELRYHPFIKDWVMIASHRQVRPQMPKDWCPFCPGSGKVPDDYEVYKYDNDFPALSPEPPAPDDVATDFFRVASAYGKCEVILYSPDHHITLPELPVDHVAKLVDLWCDRFDDLRKDPQVRYIMIFENRGEVVGVTMPHPHGQIYAYPFLPKKLELELDAARGHRREHGTCLFCDWMEQERAFAKRVIFENDHFRVILPFFTEYPYGIYIISKTHRQYITEFDEAERLALAEAVRDAAGTLDCLFDCAFPYMMCMHNAPVNIGEMGDYHFHIEFFPPMRSRDKQKFNASSETGAWAHCNPTAPEEKAQELREAYRKFKEKQV